MNRRAAAQPGLVDALPWLLLVALAAGLCLYRLQSFDYFWMLRTGQLIAETGAVPRLDPYTFTAPGARWVDIHWLFQLGLWGLYRLGGHTAPTLATWGAVLAVLALLAPLAARRARPWLGALALALLLMASSERLHPRPEVVSWVLLAAVVHLLERFEARGGRAVWAIVPLQILWANLHGLFALGIALCAIHLVGELGWPLANSGRRLRRERVWTLAGVTLAATLGALLNPNGLDGALYPIQQLTMVSSAEARGFFGGYIGELQPTLTSLGPWELGCFLALAAGSLWALALNWRGAPLSDPLSWVAFFYLALGARRNVPVFAIVAVPILMRNADAWFADRPPLRWERLAAPLLGAAFAVLAVSMAVGDYYERVGHHRVPGFGPDWVVYPRSAADWIERHRPPGPLAHRMMDGGYLIWRLHPDQLVMLDGRLEVFGPELFRSLIITSAERFEELDAEYGFGAVVQRHDDPPAPEILAHLAAHPGWQLVAVDDCAALFVRRAPAGAPAWSALDLDDPDLFPPIDPSLPARAQVMLRRRTLFLTSIGRPDLALASWKEALGLFPDIADGKRIRAELRQRARAASQPGDASAPGEPAARPRL